MNIEKIPNIMLHKRIKNINFLEMNKSVSENYIYRKQTPCGAKI